MFDFQWEAGKPLSVDFDWVVHCKLAFDCQRVLQTNHDQEIRKKFLIHEPHPNHRTKKILPKNSNQRLGFLNIFPNHLTTATFRRPGERQQRSRSHCLCHRHCQVAPMQLWWLLQWIQSWSYDSNGHNINGLGWTSLTLNIPWYPW